MKFQESETIELKRTLNKDFAKEVVAFLNTRNGIIYIGVDDNGDVLGVSNVDKTMREIRDIIRDQILPPTEGLCEIGSLLEDDKTIIVVKVTKGTKLYYIKKEGRSATGCFYRDGTSSTPMSEEDIDKRQIAALQEDKLGLVDVQSHGDDYTFDILKIKLRSKGVEINEKTFERSFRLLTKEGRYNLLAELLADKNFYSIQVCVFNGTDKLSYSKRNNFGQQSILQVYEDVKHYCEALNDTYIDDSSLPRRTKKMFDKVYNKFCIINFFRWYLRAIIPIGTVFLLGVFLITCCVPSLKEAVLEIWYIWIPTFCFLALLPWILKHLKAKEFNVFFRLKKLCLRLNATVTNERSMSFTSDIADQISKLGFSAKENIKNPPASIQEIEYELIEAFKELRGIGRKEHYVIIFDELDKIDPKGSPAYRGGTEAAQDRKRQVLSIIANMKFFLSTAQAYFVFIAGREMYEAFQADMSDRDFSINSIFHGVLNIDSFLASSREINSVTAKTEEFVCRQLLPPDFEERARSSSEYSAGYTTHGSKPFTLKNYYRYRLLERFDFSGCPTFEEYRQYVWRDVWFLYHFISYLSFISNGSPKKLALFLEKYVRSEDYLETVKRPGSHQLMQGNGKGRTFYLSLGYYSMLKVNFIHHLTYPIIQNQVNRANMFGDKLFHDRVHEPQLSDYGTLRAVPL